MLRVPNNNKENEHENERPEEKIPAVKEALQRIKAAVAFGERRRDEEFYEIAQDVIAKFKASETDKKSAGDDDDDDEGKKAASAPAREEPKNTRKKARRPFDPRPKIRLFDPKELERLIAQNDSRGDREVRQKLSTLYKNVGEAERPLAVVTKKWDALAAGLRARMPNFGAVLDIVDQTAALARRGRGVFRLPPLLLVGDPGLGKSYFCRSLGEATGCGFTEVGMSTATAPWVLTGLDASWAGSKPGLVFDSLVRGAVANPIILLDEVDKAVNDGRGRDVLGGLLPLLEPHSARRFRDEAAGLDIDASFVNWVLTANTVDTVSAPILSRLTVVEVSPPTTEQGAVIAASVWAELLRTNEWGASFSPILHPSVIDKLSTMWPRAMRKALERAAARAAISNRDEILPGDLVAAPAKKSGKLGFV